VGRQISRGLTAISVYTTQVMIGKHPGFPAGLSYGTVVWLWNWCISGGSSLPDLGIRRDLTEMYKNQFLTQFTVYVGLYGAAYRTRPVDAYVPFTNFCYRLASEGLVPTRLTALYFYSNRQLVVLWLIFCLADELLFACNKRLRH